MRSGIQQRLAQLGIELPRAAPPAGAYVPFVITANLLLISGQLPMSDGVVVHHGRVGAELSIDDGIAAARLCGINVLAQARDACDGDLDRVRRVLRLAGFVHGAPGFTEHPKVLNGASELMVDVFGPSGRHVRIAVGAATLPLGAAVEIEATFEIS